MTDLFSRVRWTARQVDAALDDSRVQAVPAATAWLRLIREGLLADDDETPVMADSDTMVEASVQCPACGASVRAHVRRDRGVVHSLTTQGDVRCGARGGEAAGSLPVTTDSSGVTCDACLATMSVFGKEGIR